MHKFIISGGGTGGHIFPAIAIANGIRKREPDAEILFVGATGRMEMEKVPAAGYKIVGLNISGIKRSLSLSNLSVPFKLILALMESARILRKFKPSVVIGVGGYASSAILFAASRQNIPTLIQEQNSFPGITNKILSKRVSRICVAYSGMEKFFPKSKLVETGNPVRNEIAQQEGKRIAGFEHFGLNPDVFTLLVIGGSLGALSINESIASGLETLSRLNIQLIWQTGKGFYPLAKNAIEKQGAPQLIAFDFIKEMDLAYACADLVVSRAGAIAVSELCIVHKATILVPYPYASEDHQTKNAQALVDVNAALMISDALARTQLIQAISDLVGDSARRETLKQNIASLGKTDATNAIVNEVYKLIDN